MIKKTTAALALLSGLLAAQCTFAQTTPLPELGFKLGDDMATVKAALKTSVDAEPMQSYRYVLDDSAHVTFNANDDGVQVIFITK
ncbi:MAG TPA: hypothetical protein VFE79_12170, partial [Paraburkholderia sp.]|jgi:hypothetical protein|nr:hypothetical protein [Paraburkholderia sp.]